MPVEERTIAPTVEPGIDLEILDSIQRRILSLATTIVHYANTPDRVSVKPRALPVLHTNEHTVQALERAYPGRLQEET